MSSNEYKLKANSELIILFMSSDIYDTYTSDQLSIVINNKENHVQKLNKNFIKLPSGIMVDNLQEYFEKKVTTFRLQSLNYFESNNDTLIRLPCYTLIPIYRTEIEGSYNDKNDLKPDLNSRLKYDDEKFKSSSDYKETIFYHNNVRCERSYKTSNLKEERWFKNEELHTKEDKSNLPAVTIIDDGYKREMWYRNGELHRDGDNPAEIIQSIDYNENDTGPYRSPIRRTWFQNGSTYRANNLPNHTEHYGKLLFIESWYRRDLSDMNHAICCDHYHEDYRELEPKCVCGEFHTSKSKDKWCNYHSLHSLHRIDGPAMIKHCLPWEWNSRKTEFWYKRGKLWRDNDLPYVTEYDKDGIGRFSWPEKLIF